MNHYLCGLMCPYIDDYSFDISFRESEPGCQTSRHRFEHHNEYPYAGHTEWVNTCVKYNPVKVGFRADSFNLVESFFSAGSGQDKSDPGMGKRKDLRTVMPGGTDIPRARAWPYFKTFSDLIKGP